MAYAKAYKEATAWPLAKLWYSQLSPAENTE